MLIDEYDHFTNELVSFDLAGFQKIVRRNGFVRKFYETIKTATGDGIVSRMFVTGVSPVTVDSYLNLSKMYEVKSEYESEKQHFDILMLETPIAEAKYEFIFEFKYEKKAGEKRIKTVLADAKTQMLGYLAKNELANHPKMKAWVIVVVGDKIEECEEVIL